MNENIKWIAAAVAVVGLSIGGIVYFSQRDKAPAPVDEPIAALPDEPALPEAPAVEHPLPAAENQEALPSLDQSDGAMKNAITGLIGMESVERFVVTDDVIRHTVVSIDNLTNPQVAIRLRPVKPAPGTFAAGGTEEALVLDPANYERYKPLVQTVRSLDTGKLVETYVRHYPLFQEAYENLGHPPQYFNDRLVEVIDHLLLTPELADPIPLVRPSVHYQFADPDLEARSAGQKLLIRMGSDNARAIKAKLRELRTELLAQRPAN
jgi:hypothetical protein